MYIPPVSHSDSGRYECKATVDLTPDDPITKRSSIHVQVYGNINFNAEKCDLTPVNEADVGCKCILDNSTILIYTN